jgi:lipopolysaccharide assembly outer membrane protein LptD (OstA)
LTAHYKESKESPNFRAFDVMVFRLSQSYDLNVARYNPGGRSRTDILGELFVQTPKMFSLSANATYNTYSDALSSHSVGATLKGNTFSVNLSEQYLHDPATQYLIGGGSLKLGKWDLSTQLWRDMENNKTTQEDYGLIYTTQCWAIRMGYTVRPGEYRYTVMWDLKGFGSRGYAKK